MVDTCWLMGGKKACVTRLCAFPSDEVMRRAAKDVVKVDKSRWGQTRTNEDMNARCRMYFPVFKDLDKVLLVDIKRGAIRGNQRFVFRFFFLFLDFCFLFLTS